MLIINLHGYLGGVIIRHRNNNISYSVNTQKDILTDSHKSYRECRGRMKEA